jgi:hypothetical protein
MITHYVNYIEKVKGLQEVALKRICRLAYDRMREGKDIEPFEVTRILDEYETQKQKLRKELRDKTEPAEII